jgi:DNA-binding transcriptional regulator YhcF (GntR family)
MSTLEMTSILSPVASAPAAKSLTGTMIGANREAVTRAFARLRENGAVETKRCYIHVENIEILKTAAEDALPR